MQRSAYGKADRSFLSHKSLINKNIYRGKGAARMASLLLTKIMSRKTAVKLCWALVCLRVGMILA